MEGGKNSSRVEIGNDSQNQSIQDQSQEALLKNGRSRARRNDSNSSSNENIMIGGKRQARASPLNIKDSDPMPPDQRSFKQVKLRGHSGKGSSKSMQPESLKKERLNHGNRSSIVPASHEIMENADPIVLEAEKLGYEDTPIREKEQGGPSYKKAIFGKKSREERAGERQKWEKLYTANRYSKETVAHYSSLSQVFKKRAQFDKANEAEMNRIQSYYGIDYKEAQQYNQKTISIFDKNNDRKGREKDDDDEVDEEEQESYWRRFNRAYEESMMQIKEEDIFYVHKQFFRFSKSSLAVFNNRNRLRWACVWLTTWKKFENFIIFMIALNSITLGVKDYTDKENLTQRNQIVESMDPFFTYIFLIECVMKIVAMGFLFGTNTYLTDAWNWLDFTVVVTSLLNEIPSMRGVSGLRTFRLFRPLRSLTTMPSMRILIGTLMQSVAQLVGIMGLTMFFFLIFAILGVSLWNGRSHYRCYVTEWPDPETGKWELLEDYNQLCSEYSACPSGSFCNSRYNAMDAGYLPANSTPVELNKDTDIQDLNYGLTNFDDIISAFLTIFQCITMEGWTQIMNIYQDAYMAWFVILYFISCIVICSVFLLNLTIAVMLMKYEELDKEHESGKSNIGKKKGQEGPVQSANPHQEELRQIGLSCQPEPLPVVLINFLIDQGSIQIQDEAQKLLKQEDSFFKQLMAPKKPTVYLEDPYYKNSVVKWCYKVIMNPYFDPVILLAIILNTGTLAIDQYPELDEDALQGLQILNYVFTVIFTAEVILKMIGLGAREYMVDKLNQFDALIVIISIVEIFTDGAGGFSAFRAIRLFKIFKYFQSGDLKILIGSITFTLSTIGDYVILLLLFTYVFALLGMSFFAGSVKFDENDQLDLVNGTPPRSNFDEIHWATITIFNVLMGESWNQIMYQGMRAQGGLVAVYYILLFMTGAIIMLNLFLAILLGNFDKARNFGQKKQVFEAFKELLASGKKLNECLDLILGDMSSHVKTKILKWDKKQVDHIHKVGDTEVAHDMLADGQGFMTQDIEEARRNNITLKYKENAIDAMIDAKTGAYGTSKQNLSNRAKRKLKANFGKPSKSSSALLGKMERNGNKYSYTVEFVHRQNNQIKRFREMSRQYGIMPYKGLKEILLKKADLDNDIESVKSDEFKDFAQLEREKQMGKKKLKQLKIGDKNLNQESKNGVSPAGVSEDDGQIGEGRDRNSRSVEKSNPNLAKLREELKESDQKQKKMKRSKTTEPGKLKGDITLSKGSRNEFLSKSTKRKVSQFGDQGSPRDKSPTQVDKPESLRDSSRSILTTSGGVDHFANCSCFLFHRDSKFRSWCMNIAIEPENILKMKFLLKVKKIDQYNAADDTNLEYLEKFASNGKKKDEELEKLRKVEDDGLNKRFNDIILVLIILSSITLILDNPLYDPESQFMKILQVIDIGFTFLFFIEAAIKIIAMGFLFNRLGPVTPYIRNYWNILDFFVVCASCIDLIFLVIGLDASSIQSLKALRVFRALRPLRMISKDPGMKLVVNALLASIPSMNNVLLVCSLIILIFSIMGVNFFKGSFYHCVDDPKAETPIDMDKVMTKADCVDKYGGLWVNKDMNFDNTLNSMFTLFQMMTTEGWLDVMEAGLDSRGIDLQPKYNSNVIISVLFFLTFMIIGSQFIINLFVGVVIDNFQTIKEKEELDNMFVTEDQRKWIEIQKVAQGKALRVKIDEPTGCRYYFHWLVNHVYFEYSITFFILLNTVFMAIQHYRQDPMLEFVSEIANYVFAFVFNMEMILKLIGLGKIYFMYSWNIFDMIIVIATDIGLLLKWLNLGETFSSAATVVRSFRIMRMFKLIRSSVNIRLILDTVFNILPQIKNVMTLILLLLFIFAALGINLFAQVMLQDSLNKKNNYQTFFGALVLLMSFSTGEDWNAFMYELANQEGYDGEKCVAEQTYEQYVADGEVTKQCGAGFFSYVYFFTFVILVQILIMNLSVAAVIEGLDTAKKENMGIVQGDDIDNMIELWQEYDTTASGWITTKQLIFFLYELKPPLGKPSTLIEQDQDFEDDKNQQVGRKEERYVVNYDKGIVLKKRQALALLKGLKIKVNKEHQVHFVDVFKALIKRKFEEDNIDYKLSPNLNKKIKSQWVQRSKDVKNKYSEHKFTAEQQQAGLIIVRWLESRYIHKIKNTASRKKQANQFSNNQKQKKDESQSMAQKMLQEQADTIYRIIKGLPELEENQGLNNSHSKGQHAHKWNAQTWKDAGGDKLLNQLDKDFTDFDYDDETSEVQHPDFSTYHLENNKKLGVTKDNMNDTDLIKEESVSKETDGKRSTHDHHLTPQCIEKEVDKITDPYANDLYGPEAQKIMKAQKEGTFNDDSNKGKKDVQEKKKPAKNSERLQINILNLENEESKTRMIFETDKQGVLKRSEKLEKQAIKLEKDQLLADNKHVDSDDDEAAIEKKREKHERMMFHARRQKELEAEQKRHEKMQSKFRRDWNMIDNGFSGNTIEMDERFEETNSFIKMNAAIQNPTKMRHEDLEDISHGRGESGAFLAVVAEPREDLIGRPDEVVHFPAKMNRNRDQAKSQVLIEPKGKLTNQPEEKKQNNFM